MRKCLPIAFVLMVLILAGCSHVPAGFAPYASPMESGETTIVGHAKGSAGYFSLFGVIPFGKPDYDAAIGDAVSKVPGGKKLINVRSWFSSGYVIIGTVHILHVEGDVVK